MLNKHLKKYYKKFSGNKYINKFSKFVGAKHLWDFSRTSVAKGIAVGIGCAWIPLPFHTIIAIFLAILFDCNIPIVAGVIWVANPITMPFMYYFAYIVGDFLLNVHQLNFKFHLSMHDVMQVMHVVWEPFVLGCLACGLISAIIAYTLAQILWPNLSKHLKK